MPYGKCRSYSRGNGDEPSIRSRIGKTSGHRKQDMSRNLVAEHLIQAKTGLTTRPDTYRDKNKKPSPPFPGLPYQHDSKVQHGIRDKPQQDSLIHRLSVHRSGYAVKTDKRCQYNHYSIAGYHSSLHPSCMISVLTTIVPQCISQFVDTHYYKYFFILCHLLRTTFNSIF